MSYSPNFGNRVRPCPDPPRGDVHFGSVTPRLISASRNGWFDDPDELFYMGHGNSTQGKTSWIYALENESMIRPGGIYVEDDPAGYVLFSPLPERRIMGVTLWVHPGHRRSRVGTSILTRVLDMLFRRGVYRVETETLRRDDRAQGFLRSFGMKQEGHRIRSLWIGQTAYDTTTWRVLQPDWQVRNDETYWKEN